MKIKRNNNQFEWESLLIILLSLSCSLMPFVFPHWVDLMAFQGYSFTPENENKYKSRNVMKFPETMKQPHCDTHGEYHILQRQSFQRSSYLKNQDVDNLVFLKQQIS